MEKYNCFFILKIVKVHTSNCLPRAEIYKSFLYFDKNYKKGWSKLIAFVRNICYGGFVTFKEHNVTICNTFFMLLYRKLIIFVIYCIVFFE